MGAPRRRRVTLPRRRSKARRLVRRTPRKSLPPFARSIAEARRRSIAPISSSARGSRAAGSPAGPVEGLDQAGGVCDEAVVLLRERMAPLGEGVVLHDEVAAPALDPTPKIGQLGIEAPDLRVHGLELCARAVEPGLQRLALAPGRGLVLGVELGLRALEVRLLGLPLG